MSSTERAPEPTMEEILASIRRIISDDEANSTQQRATSSEYAEQVRVEDAEYEAADTQMIADIERALGNVSVAAEPFLHRHGWFHEEGRRRIVERP
jgi:cell pole-organizing protein PopZ